MDSEHTLPSIMAPSAASALQACNICCQQVAGPDHQNHMGRHILQKFRGMPVAEPLENVVVGSVSESESFIHIFQYFFALIIIYITRSQQSTLADFVVNLA